MNVAFATRFVGRDRELREVRDLVADNRVVTLTGIGGSGKTRLAAEVLHGVESAYADGVWLVPLADLTDASLLGHTVAGALGLHLPGSGWDPQVMTEHLRDRRVLLGLDNCEHLVQHVALLVAGLVRDCPRLSVLATSRMPLGIARETVYEVPSLNLPGDPGLPPDELARFDAVALFVDRAQAASASFRLTPANSAGVAELVEALDGMPLALELAAARVRGVAPQVLVTRLGDRLALLDSGFVDVPERHRSLAASVEWSYQLCTPEEQALWCRLAVFVGGFNLDAAEAVCAGGDIQPEDVLGLLLSLADQSVISMDPDTPGRYRMLETMRQFGASQLRSARDLQTWQDAHLSWFEALSRTVAEEWSGPDQPDWLIRLRREHANLRAALEYAVGDPRTSASALRLCRNLEPYWVCDGVFNEARHWVDLGLAQPSGSPAERALAADMCAWFASIQIDPHYAHSMLDQAAVLLETTDDGFVRGGHLIAAGMVDFYDGDLEGSVRHQLEARSEFARAGHEFGHGYLQATFFAAMALALQGRHEEATLLCSDALAVCESRGELFLRASILWALGLSALASGDLTTAEEREQQALRCAWKLRDELASAMSLEVLAWTEAALGRGPQAAILLGAAESIWRVIHLPVDRSPHFAELRTAGAASARDVAGRAEFDKGFAEGLAIGTAGAVALAEQPVPPTRSSGGAPGVFAPLTRREAEVAELVAEGLSNREIAARLVISERTVDGHVEHMLAKLQARSRAKIATFYVRRSWSAATSGRGRTAAVGED